MLCGEWGMRRIAATLECMVVTVDAVVGETPRWVFLGPYVSTYSTTYSSSACRYDSHGA